MTRHISRRAAIAGLAAALALQLPHHAMAGTSELSETLLSVVDDRRAAAAIGEFWIQHKRGGGPNPASLVNNLADMLHAQGWSGSSDPAELRRLFDAAARADYQRGETVTVAGWQLARSQANLCALAYFSTAGLL